MSGTPPGYLPFDEPPVPDDQGAWVEEPRVAVPEPDDSPPEMPAGERPPSPPPQGGTSGLAFFKDNLEAFAIAIVMALVIKHFCVEAFKIPTGSMVPTLLGDNFHPDHDGDRILVDKFAYLFSEPDRWEIPVFRYPLNRARNFIKRIAGLGGERLRIHEGNVWVRPTNEPDTPFRIARKNRRVREAHYFAVYPPRNTATTSVKPEDVWRVDGPAGAWTLPAHGELDFVGGQEASAVVKAHIYADSESTNWPKGNGYGPFARDARLQAVVGLGPPIADTEDKTRTIVTLSWSPDGEWRAALTLSSESGGSQATIFRNNQVWKTPAKLNVRLSRKHALSVELEFVNGDLRAWVDGEELAVIPDERHIEEASTSGRDQELRIQAEGGPVHITDIRIARDLHYGNSFKEKPEWQREGLDIPEGAYFMLGDNTASSSDSRKWQIRTVFLLDGTEIMYDDSESGPDYLDDDMNQKRITDVNGVMRTWSEDDEDPDRGSRVRNAPFVWRDLIVGRAFLIFWPLRPDFPRRLRFIH